MLKDMDASEIPDATLWKSLKGGDTQAFGALYERYAKSLVSYSYRITGDTHLIKDCLHELFLEIWKNREGLKEIEHIKYYLFHSLRNKIRKKLRLSIQKEQKNSVFSEEAMFIESYEALLIDRQLEEEMTLHLKKALLKLTARQQEAITLRYYNNFSNEEIAGIMGISYQAATNLLHLALKLLRKELHLLFFEFIFFICCSFPAFS